ncbi:MAG: exosome complex RNA-binding protein Rrp4, partial [Candidatus Hodarchaeota archaeon]
GQILAEGRYRASRGTYDQDGKIYSALVGLAELRGNTVKVVALEGVYIPREGDLVLGTITIVAGNNWKIDIGGPYLASLHANNALRRPYDEDISRYMDIGDVVVAEITAFDRVSGPFLSMKGRGLRKLSGGMILEISPAKVPRVIGRRGSMINMIKDTLRIQTVVGQNGRIWIRAPNLEILRLAIKAFRMIEEQAHTSKLTDRVHEMLIEELESIDGVESLSDDESLESEEEVPVDDEPEDVPEDSVPKQASEPIKTDDADQVQEDGEIIESEEIEEETENTETEDVSEE